MLRHKPLRVFCRVITLAVLPLLLQHCTTPQDSNTYGKQEISSIYFKLNAPNATFLIDGSPAPVKFHSRKSDREEGYWYVLDIAKAPNPSRYHWCHSLTVSSPGYKEHDGEFCTDRYWTINHRTRTVCHGWEPRDGNEIIVELVSLDKVLSGKRTVKEDLGNALTMGTTQRQKR